MRWIIRKNYGADAPERIRRLEKDIVSIGVNNRIEIWNKDNWSEYSDEEDYISNELAFEMENLGI